MNIGLFWLGPSDRSFPELLPSTNLLPGEGLQFTWKDLLVLVVVVPLMLALSRSSCRQPGSARRCGRCRRIRRRRHSWASTSTA
jgi:hypothetical protein